MLHHYAAEDKVQKIRSAIITGSAEVDARDGNKWTPIHHAAAAGSLAAMKILVEAGGDIDAQTRTGDTPLLLSAKDTDDERHMLCIEHLLGHGADPAIANNKGLTATEALNSLQWRINASFVAGADLREKIKVRQQREAERLADARKMEQAQKAIDEVEAGGKGGKSGASPVRDARANKRAQYLRMREQLAVKMKQHRTSHASDMSEITVAMTELRAEQKHEAEEARLDGEGFMGIEGAAEWLQEPASVAELSELEGEGADDDELEARRFLIVCEHEATRLAQETAHRRTEIEEMAPQVEAVSSRGAQLVSLRPLATLLRFTLRVKKRAAEIREAERLREEDEERRLGTNAIRVLEREAAAAEYAVAKRAAELAALVRTCERCGVEFMEDETNTPYVCRWHPGHKMVLQTWGSAYSCCRRTGNGCSIAKHSAPVPEIPTGPWQPPLPTADRRVFGATLLPPSRGNLLLSENSKYPPAGSYRYPGDV